MYSIDSIETYAYGTSKGLICRKEKNKCNNIIKNTKMFNSDYITKEDRKEHKPNWSKIPDHPYRILITGGSGSGKRNALLNLIIHEPDIDKIYSYAKDQDKAKYQFLIDKRESDKYNPNKKRKILTVFDMIADMLNNKKLNPIVAKLFLRGRKLNVSLDFITLFYFDVSKILD